MGKKSVVWFVIGIALLAVVVIGLSSAGGSIEDVDAAGVQKAIDQGAQVVDVRTEGEFQVGHIPGAINTPVDQIGQAAQSWDRDKTYVVYCATGSRSVTAVKTMVDMGFTNIRHFAAGMQAWNGQVERGASTGGTVETAGKPVFIEFFTST